MASGADSVGRLPAALLEDKYCYFSDNTIKDRVAFHAHRASNKKAPTQKKLEPSGRADTGWDKYYFFSATYPNVSPTARKGRSRPAAQGPQTFKVEAFSKEELASERRRIEALGPRTAYTESYSQFPRTTQAEFGPPGEHEFSHGGGGAAASSSDASGSGFHGAGAFGLASSASDSALRPPSARIMAAHELLDRQRPEGRVRRAGPMWPPPGQERPTVLKARSNLFRGSERHIVDLYATDRKAPASYLYTITNV